MSLLTAQPGSSHDHPQAWKPREERSGIPPPPATSAGTRWQQLSTQHSPA